MGLVKNIEEQVLLGQPIRKKENVLVNIRNIV